MRKVVLLAPLASLILVACGSSDEAGEGDSISMGEVAAITQENAIKPEPGQYSVSMEVLEMDIPGAPESAVTMMKDMMGQRAHSYCMTQEDADNGFEEMAKQSQENDDCSFERYEFDGGKLDGKMVCNVPGQGTMTMTIAGTGSATRSEMEMTMEGNMTGMGESTIRLKAIHERTGDCAG